MGVAQLLRRPPRRVRRWSLDPWAEALLVVPGLVWQSSYAGFSDSTAPLAATVGTGQLLLGNSVSVVGTAVSLGELLPGRTSAYCIAVTSTGTVPAEVRLYGRGMSATKALDSAVQLSWVAGTGGGTDGDCTGFVPSGPTSDTTFSSFPTSWATGGLPRAPTR